MRGRGKREQKEVCYHFTMKAADGQPSSEAAKSRARQPVEISVG